MAREFKTGVIIKGDARGAVSATKATRDELDKLNKSVQNQTALGKYASGGLATYAARVAGVAAVAASTVGFIGRFAKSVADNADRIRDLSIQLGTSTEFISGMAHAADLSGSSLEQFATGLRKMEKSIGDLSTGAANQVQAFGRLGLTYEKIRSLSPEEQFLEIADRLGGMADNTLRVATAMDIFGRSGAELIPLLAEGKDGIGAMRAEAERLGLVISQEFADQADQFNDDLTRVQGVMTGVKNQIGEGLLPSLTALMQAFVEGADSTDTWKDVGEFFGNLVRVLVAGFITLREIVVLTGETIWATGKIIVETLIAIAAPVLEFGKTLETAFNALVAGDFSKAADAFTGLGERMKTAFVDNITVVELTLKEFGQDAAVRVEEAIADVNDALTRQAKIAPNAAAGMNELGEDTAKAAKAAEDAAKAYESLVDRLDPLAKLSRQFTVEQAILAGKIDEGGDGLAYYTQLLEILKEEYAEAARSAVGFGEDAAAAAEKAADRAAKAAEREAASRAKALEKQQADLDTFQTAFERGAERLDDLGADLFRSWFTSSKNILKSIKDYFLNWLAEMAYAAFARPIVVQITTALVGGATGTSAIAGGLGGGLPGGGGFAGIGNMFTGNSIGAGFAGLGNSLPGRLGGPSTAGTMGPNYGIAQGGMFANAGAYSNIAYGIAGILGGLLGNKIFGGQGGLGGSFGATLGLAIGGPMGAIAGGLIGGFLGGLFKKRAPVVEVTGYSLANVSSSDDDNTFTSSLGGGFLRSRRVDSATIAQFGKDIASFDDSIASFLDKDQIAAATEALKGFKVYMTGSAITMEDVLNQRFAVILGTFTADIQEFVREVSDLPGQVERLAMATTAQKIIDAAPDLFEGRTFRDFIAVAESMQEAGEDLTTTFQRLLNEVIIIAQQLDLVKGFASSDLAADFDAMKAGQGMTLKDYTGGLADQIRELASSSTGSAEDLANLSVLVSQRYDSEIAYLQQIDQIMAGISGGFQGLKEQINRDMFGDEAFYNQVTSQAEQLAKDLKTMTDPAQIAATVAEIQRLTGIAYGLLDPAGKAAKGQGFLDFIAGVEADAGAALTLARDLFIEESQVLRDLVAEMGESFADPLTIAATAHETAATDLGVAAINLSSSAAEIEWAADQLPVIVRNGFNDIRQGIISAGAPPPAGAPANMTQAATLIANTVAGAVVQSGNAAAGAIQSSIGRIRVQVVLPGGGMVNA